MSVITWQNINAPSSRDVGRELGGAQLGISGGFDKLAEILNAREAVKQGVADRARNAGAEDYLNTIQGFKTPEELNAARLSGVLDQRIAALDPRNQAAVRGAADARLTSLQTQTTAANAFDNSQRTFRDAPTLDQGTVLAANGDVAGFNAWRAQNPLVRGTADLVPKLQAGAVAAVSNPNVIAEQKLKTELFPQTSANQKLEAKIRGIELPVQQQQAENNAQDQAVIAATTSAAQTYQENQHAGRMKLVPFAKQLGLPLDSTGAPDYLNMSEGDRLRLNNAAIVAGVATTSADSLYSGDTKTANDFLSQLRKNPTFTPEAITRNQAKITGAFSTVGTGAPVGNDALLINRRLAQADVRVQEESLRNRFAPGSPDALNAYEQLATTIKAEMPDNVKEDLPALQKLLAELSTKGLEISPGKFITPSSQDILGEIRGYDKWNFLNSTQANDIKANLKKSLSGIDVTGLQQQREEALLVKRQKAVRDILNPVTPAMAPLNPLQIAPNQPPPRR